MGATLTLLAAACSSTVVPPAPTVSRDSQSLYVTNRGEGSVSVIDLATGKPVTKWRIPGGGSPDMGNVSADGTKLWLAARYDNVVYVIDTRDDIWSRRSRWAADHTG